MTNHNYAKIYDSQKTIIRCKIFPGASKSLNHIGFFQFNPEKNKKIENGNTMKKFAQFRDSITYHIKFRHTLLRSKQILAKIHPSNIEIESLNVVENMREIVSTINNVQIWRLEERSDDRIWEMKDEKNEVKKGKFNLKWHKLRSIPFILLLQIIVIVIYSPVQLVMAKLKNDNAGYCEPNGVPLLATSRIVTPALAAIFGRTCRCSFDWRSHFCKQIERYKSLLAIPEMQQHENAQLPIVCICRQLILENNCHQFMTQCYFTSKNQHEECKCCFNQPNAFCNQLQCRNGEPIFGMHANTTCICHAPAFYPYNICTYQNSLFYDHREVVTSDREHADFIKHPLHESSIHHDESIATKLYSIQITPTSAIATVLGLLGVIILLTVILLVIRSYRTYREHRNRAAKRELAQSILLEQRAEEEKYLP